MIDMFTNYQNLSDYYIPNNLAANKTQVDSYTKFKLSESSKPYELYNAKGELEGYYWYYKNTLNLEFMIDGELTLESDAIVYNVAGKLPSIRTEGFIDQRCYNIADMRSWTCKGADTLNHEFIWIEDAEFIYPTNGAGHTVFISAADYLADKTLKFTIYNFRMEELYTTQIPGTSQAIFAIDSKLSETLVRGIYYCSLELFGNETYEIIFSPSDCKLLVK